MIYLALFCLAAALNIAVGFHDWPGVLAGSLNDPDSYMRLVRIGQGVRAGHLLVRVAGDDSGAGVMVEWSRLLDAALWLLAAPMAPFLGWHKALFTAGVAFGPLSVGALGAATAWAVEPFAARAQLWSAAAASALLPGIIAIARPGVVHYHVALLALIMLTAGLVARAWRNDRWTGFLAGLSGGFAIWLTPETMPFVLMAYAVLVLRWLTVQNADVLLATAAGCCDVLIAALMLDPPEGGYEVVEVDRLSLVYAAMGLALLAGAGILFLLHKRLRRRRGPLGLAILAALLAGWVAVFPQVAMGPYGVLPPDEAKLFFGAIAELQPPHGAGAVTLLLPGALAVLYALFRAWDGRRPHLADMAGPAMLGAPKRLPWLWLYLALCGGVALALAQRWLLFAAFPAGFAAALLPVALSDLGTRVKAGTLMRVSVAALVLAVPLLANLASAPRAVAGAACPLRGIAPLLEPAAGQVVLAMPELTPELLYRTEVKTVGSLYQHGVPAYLRDRAAWRAPPGRAVPPAVADTKAAYVLFCPGAARHILVADLPRDTLWDALNTGNPPAWLARVGGNADGWVLYRITP